MSNQIDPEHNQMRDLLRVVGPVVCVIGAIFTAIGLWSFFSAFGGGGPPRYFWCGFVGLPLVSIGSAICKYAYIGAVTRYIANEVSPVGKDVVNYMAEGTKGAVREMAAAVGEGLRTRASSEERGSCQWYSVTSAMPRTRNSRTSARVAVHRWRKPSRVPVAASGMIRMPGSATTVAKWWVICRMVIDALTPWRPGS